MSDPLIVRMRDVRAAHNCSGGCRAFCERYGIDYGHFLDNGISAEKLAETGDELAMQVIRKAEENVGK